MVSPMTDAHPTLTAGFASNGCGAKRTGLAAIVRVDVRRVSLRNL
jgi:hypothetical protein